MPVSKKAPRPMSAGDDPREPHVSDNDLTVLFRRVARQVRRPGPAPKPPVSAITPGPRARNLAGRPTPLAMTVRPQERIGTVTVAPRTSERAVQIGVLLAIGCLVGVLVEIVARPGPEPWRTQSALASTVVANGAVDEPREKAAGARPVPRDDVHRAHTSHHHARHASSTSSTPVPARAPDAGSDSDDVAAAVKMLTKAKAEETLP